MILVAPTAFKGTIGAAAAAAAIAAGIRRTLPEARVRTLPLSDGGPGLIDAIRAAHDGAIETVRVTGPLGGAVRARVLRAGIGRVVESADACGLHLIRPDRLNPLEATTKGVAELILAAAPRAGATTGAGAGGRGPDRLVIGLGGSATVDGGAGMAQALGWRLIDEAGKPIPAGGGGLRRLAAIEPPPSPPALPAALALADVRNPLVGPHGAAAVFAPQKGADAAGVRILEEGLTRLADRIAADLGVAVSALEGGGAAGGLGAALVAFLGAELVSGSEWVLQACGFDAALQDAALVVTGEGAYDAQSAMGKVTGKVVARARARGVPVLVVAGRIEVDLPDGVAGAAAGGERLDEEGLAALVSRAAPQLLTRKGLRNL